ncbi:hypothetical protein N0V93_002932 [Gnomoniopsis smithogilvyi]|uniref:N-alpha-acetyltransferase 40 n=1 Tax=Gnomoniopsis smithogilvyi TaxID=1191159 RepID=A0A9W9CZE6_9PEZI|nr:hypothetical protein N0V93_002932 [Gnomoniopsis smithogilvyi]
MMSKRQRLRAMEDAIKQTTTKSDVDFLTEFVASDSEGSSSSWSPTWHHPRTDAVYSLSLSQAQNTSNDDLEACFSLVKETSQKDYAASSRGWNPTFKRKEMREPDLRYILVKDLAGQVCGYLSLMPTMEEGEAVVYCYEIHLKPELRGTGLAGLLMGFLDIVARNIEVMEKVMLTVFTCNTRAVKFYQRCGFEVDDMSPKRRKLRNGIVKEPDYVIMSKRVERGQDGTVGVTKQMELTATPPAKIAKIEKGNVDVKTQATSKD